MTLVSGEWSKEPCVLRGHLSGYHGTVQDTLNEQYRTKSATRLDKMRSKSREIKVNTVWDGWKGKNGDSVLNVSQERLYVTLGSTNSSPGRNLERPPA